MKIYSARLDVIFKDDSETPQETVAAFIKSGGMYTHDNLDYATIRSEDGYGTHEGFLWKYLIGADLRGINLPADVPVIPNIHQEVYGAVEYEPYALDMRDWHTCRSTHCRAGWVVTLAGEAGRELEKKHGTPIAATLIYMASDPMLERIPDWLAIDEEALEDMKRLANA